MNSFKISVFAIFIGISSAVVSAGASTLYCTVGVYKAKDLLDESGKLGREATQVLEVPLKSDGSSDQEFQVNGETVAAVVYKYEHTDLYSLTFVLKTPVADRMNRAGFVTTANDFMYNDGPTEQNGWDLKPSPTAIRYAFLNRESGTFGLSPKVVAAMKSEGVWGKTVTSARLDASEGRPIVEFVKDQIAQKKMNEDDVIGISTMFSCTIDK